MGATIGAQLEALANQSWPEAWEITQLLHLRLVDSSDRPGASHARNVGARAATAPALAFCDADDEVGPGWVAAMGNALVRHDFVACLPDGLATPAPAPGGGASGGGPP